ncbi:MAG: nuclear transport factor 2 family protein [Cyanobacteria bacterium SID2]|nr:nuclear transport factor 2 family protein [Cyanobacteria bacterium SID2]MBP0003490.1 nuclear transport factor 2 family protein [Cyanobacteria bacterium SBC]
MTATRNNAIAILGIDEPVVCQYFETLNAGAFDRTASLFAERGELHPPFTEAVVGREEIEQYLQDEAEGICCLPQRGEVETLEDGTRLVKIAGKVKMPLFGVNVTWLFRLDATSQLLGAKIQLVASPQELLGLKRFA